MTCEGPAPTRDELVDHLRSRLDRIPRYRQRPRRPPLPIGKPFWLDDPAFDLQDHVRRTVLPSPGDAAELRRLVGRIFSQRLDRSKPLWELWIVEGLDDDRFAVINKTHHAVIDAIGGIDITTAMFDLEPTVSGGDPPASRSAPTVPTTALLGQVARDAAATPLRLAGRAVTEIARGPRHALGSLAERLRAIGELGGVVATGGAVPLLNGPIGRHREIDWFHAPLDDLKAIKNALGGTVNDAFLAIVAGALGRWSSERGVDPARWRLRAVVPVSIRSDDQHDGTGNRIVAMFADLPWEVPGPVDRQRIVAESLEEIKESGQAMAADAIASIEELAPPAIVARASKLQFSTRLYNLLVSNVAGPQVPVFVLGRRLERFVPIAFLAPDKRLAIAMVSYDGEVTISVIGDRDNVDGVPELARVLGTVLDETRAAARKRDSAPATVA